MSTPKEIIEEFEKIEYIFSAKFAIKNKSEIYKAIIKIMILEYEEMLGEVSPVDNTVWSSDQDKFFEYMSQGYAGGKDGLRCSVCDHKFRGEANIVQLCPRCMAGEVINKERSNLRLLIEAKLKAWRELLNNK